jgi:DNA polymerase-2
LFSRDLFPLAFVDIQKKGGRLVYTLKDDVASTDYSISTLEDIKDGNKDCKERQNSTSHRSHKQVTLTQQETTVTIGERDEAETLLKLAKAVWELDPDFLLTNGGDSYVFPYLAQRAAENQLSYQFTLSRDPVPLSNNKASGSTYFSYGRTFFRANPQRLFGRVHIDYSNTFVISEADIDGLIEIARTCRVPLHTAARNSIGSSMPRCNSTKP